MIIVFKKRGGIFAAAIKLWTRGPYSHCELMWEDCDTFSSAAPDSGTRFLSKPKICDAEWDAFWIDTSKLTSSAIRRSCMDELNCGYDWLGILMACVLGVSRQSDTKWFCSEICAWALMKHGVLPQSKPHFQDPNSFARLIQANGAKRLSIVNALIYERKAVY